MWRVANPYTTNLPLTDLTYSLASGGSTFIDGKVTPTGSIPARGKKIIQIPATVPFRSLLAALKSIKPGAVVPYAAQFKIGVCVSSANTYGTDETTSHSTRLPKGINQVAGYDG